MSEMKYQSRQVYNSKEDAEMAQVLVLFKEKVVYGFAHIDPFKQKSYPKEFKNLALAKSLLEDALKRVDQDMKILAFKEFSDKSAPPQNALWEADPAQPHSSGQDGYQKDDTES